MISAVNKLKRSNAPILFNGLSGPVFRGVSVKHLSLDESTSFILIKSVSVEVTCMVEKIVVDNEYTTIP